MAEKIDYLFSDDHLEAEPPSVDLGWERELKHENPNDSQLDLAMIRRRKREWPFRASENPYEYRWLPDDDREGAERSAIADRLLDAFLSKGESAARSLWQEECELPNGNWGGRKPPCCFLPNAYDVTLALRLWSARILQDELEHGEARASARVIRACEQAYGRLLSGGSAADYERLERLRSEITGVSEAVAKLEKDAEKRSAR